MILLCYLQSPLGKFSVQTCNISCNLNSNYFSFRAKTEDVNGAVVTPQNEWLGDRTVKVDS